MDSQISLKKLFCGKMKSELLLGLCFLQIMCEWGKPTDNNDSPNALGNSRCLLLERASMWNV
jgi:hypothetical protein